MVSKGLLSGQELQRFVEQIIEHAKEEEVFKVFSQDMVGVQQRFVEQTAKRPASAVWRGSGGAVRLLRDSHGSGHDFHEPCTCEHQPSCSCVSLRLLLEEFPCDFFVKVDPNSEADRCSHLELLDNFCEPLVSGSHGPCVLASVYGGFGRISRFFYVKANSDPEVRNFSERRF